MPPIVICILVAALPWGFGPYQQQAYQMSRQLDASGYRVKWMMHSRNYILPREEFGSRHAMLRALHVDDPALFDAPVDFQDEHLTYVGFGADTRYVRISELNRLARLYQVDLYLTLFDVLTILARDADFVVPSVAWLPLHHYGDPAQPSHISLAPTERYTLDSFAVVAALAPSAQQRLWAANVTPPVHYVPHMLAMLAAPPRRTTTPLPTLPRSSFVVLFQGGNYERMDRKGLDAAIQAFARFYHARPRAHLVIHAIASQQIAGQERRASPPPNLVSKGPNLPLLLALSGLPRRAYTVDTSIQSPEWVAALKRRANVCLHPSKTEGFGLNVLECQLHGTPVISTAYGAMRDFTRYGTAVPCRQTALADYDHIATPDVPGIVRALHRAFWRQRVSRRQRLDAMRWVHREFAPTVVAARMQRAVREALMTELVPTPAAYTVVQGDMLDVTDVSTPWVFLVSPGLPVHRAQIQQLVSTTGGRDMEFDVLMFPIKEAGDAEPGAMTGELLRPRVPALIRTFMFLHLQLQQTTRLGMLYQAIRTDPRRAIQVPGVYPLE
jgi:glycosyltransferase involved in cell wall biosynthesis